jgi:hypothetical protein
LIPISWKKKKTEPGDIEMHIITGHILSLLNDSSFPPLVMLDGNWGEGKTYFTKNTLIPDLKDKGHSSVFFSLTGISNINDFKDRLLSSSYIKSEINSNTGESLSAMFTSIVSQLGGESGGTIATILSGASGLVKESMLSRLSDRVIIIDDLDRVKDTELSNLIIGECLQLSDGSDLKFLFIVNDKKNLADSALKEKVFSGIVKLNKGLSETIEIAFSKNSWFEQYRGEIESVVEHKNLKNLRVLKRASKKLEEIYKILQSDGSLDMDGCMSKLIKVSLLVIFYHYEKEFTEVEIWDRSENGKMLPGEKFEYGDLVEINCFLTKALISFLVGGSNWNLSLEDFGRLQKKGCPIDSFMFSPHFDNDDESFERNVDTLQYFVFDQVDVSFSKWFEASYFYYFLQSNEFLGDSRPDILEKFDKLFPLKNFDYSDLDGRNNRLRIDSEVKFIFEKYVKEKESYRFETAQNKQSDIFVRMSKSWKDVDIEIYRSHQLKPFFNQFSKEQLLECVKGWKNSDILIFSDFISGRYEPVNIKTYLLNEFEITEELHKEVEVLYKSEPAGRKKGALRSLNDNLSLAVKALTTDGE